MDHTQENLHALATKVAHWSKEAASLSAGLKEEALLLELSSQAERMALAEARRHDMHEQQQVKRLDRENVLLREELRDMTRLCSLLLERTPPPPPRAAAAARRSSYAEPARGSIRADWPDSLRPAPAAARPDRPHSSRPATAVDSAGIAAAPRYTGGWGGGFATPPRSARSPAEAAELPYTSLSYLPTGRSPAVPATLRMSLDLNDTYGGYGIRGSRGYGASDIGVYSDADGEAQAAEAAAAEAEAEAAEAEAEAAAAYAQAVEREDEPEGEAVEDDDVTDLEADADVGGQDGAAAEGFKSAEAGFMGAGQQEHRELGDALAALDEALAELTLHVPAPAAAAAGGDGSRDYAPRGTGGHSRGGTLPGSAPATPAAVPGAGYDDDGVVAAVGDSDEDGNAAEEGSFFPEPHSAAGTSSFAGFPQQPAAGGEREQDTPAVPERWRRPVPQQDVGMQATPEEQALLGGDAEASDEEEQVVPEAAAVGARQVVMGTPKRSPAKLAGGAPVSAPATPVYQGVPREVPDTVRRPAGAPAPAATASYTAVASASAAAAAATAAAAQRSAAVTAAAYGFDTAASPYSPPRSVVALDSMLLTEVEKLKQVNRALAATLQSYNRVSDRIGAATATTGAGAVTPPAAPSRPLSTTGSTASSTARALFTAAGAGTAQVRPGTAPAPATPQPAAPAASYYPTSYAAARPRSAVGAAATAPSPRAQTLPRPSTARPSVFAASPLDSVRPLDVSLDLDLYGIRRELEELKHEMAADRLRAAAATAAGGTPGMTAAAAAAAGGATRLGGASPWSAARSSGLGLSGAAQPPSAMARYRDATDVGRLREEISELRRQLQGDRRWYYDSLDAVVSERSAMFEQLQRRLDRLVAWA